MYKNKQEVVRTTNTVIQTVDVYSSICQYTVSVRRAVMKLLNVVDENLAEKMLFV